MSHATRSSFPYKNKCRTHDVEFTSWHLSCIEGEIKSSFPSDKLTLEYTFNQLADEMDVFNANSNVQLTRVSKV